MLRSWLSQVSFQDALDATLLTFSSKCPRRSWCYALDVFQWVSKTLLILRSWLSQVSVQDGLDATLLMFSSINFQQADDAMVLTFGLRLFADKNQMNIAIYCDVLHCVPLKVARKVKGNAKISRTQVLDGTWMWLKASKQNMTKSLTRVCRTMCTSFRHNKKD